MSKIFNDINDLPILDCLDAAWVSYKKDGWSPYMYTILKPDGSPDSSFKVNTTKNIAVDFGWSWVKWGSFDIIGRYVLQVDTATNTGKVETVKWFVEKWLVKDEQIKKKFEKSLGKEELLTRFKEFRLWGYKEEFGKWLKWRWVSHDFIVNHVLEIGEFCKDIAYYDNFYCSEDTLTKNEEGEIINESRWVPVLMFPSFHIDENDKKILVGMKLRRIDGKTIYGKKSYAVGKTWLIWNKIDPNKTVFICEWEADWVIMQILGYKNTVGNEGWVQSQRAQLKRLLFECHNIVCLYDNDDAGQLGKKTLMESLGKKIYQVDMPIQTWPKWEKISDINDLYKVGYDTDKRWNKIFAEAYEVWGVDKKTMDRFAFLEYPIAFYDTVAKTLVQDTKVANFKQMTVKEVFQIGMNGGLPKYKDTCYWYGWKDGYLNTMNEDEMILHWGDADPYIHPDIEALIYNVWGRNKKNIDWLHGAILWKLTHINSVNIPAVILFGTGGSGKGTWVMLLSKIFWESNTLRWLGQRDLERGSDSYSWEKLIVEFMEVSSGNTFEDKKITDRIKSFVGEKTITVKKLYQDPKEVENIAWFQFSSNHTVPVQLDATGNRRFTIIKTPYELDHDVSDRLYRDVFPNEDIIRSYIAWLYENYGDVIRMQKYPVLENDEKTLLEEHCAGAANTFFKWFEKEYPLIWKISIKQKNVLVDIYLQETSDGAYNDIQWKQKNFDNSLNPGKYEKKGISIDGKAVRGYLIRKSEIDMEIAREKESIWYFTREEWQKVELRLRSYNNIWY